MIKIHVFYIFSFRYFTTHRLEQKTLISFSQKIPFFVNFFFCRYSESFLVSLKLFYLNIVFFLPYITKHTHAHSK
uniref:Uncharacterized protein n=1 Tax=Lutzomyia longipalpis TaxID=7200 RepID=A0A7G3B6W5_LUTLO